MATGTTHSYNDREFFFRLQTLIIDGGTTVLRNIFDQQLGIMPLNVFLANEKTKINRLRGQKIITTSQYDQLYPQGSQIPSITDFDIRLITCLLMNLPSLGLNTHYRWNYQPQPTDLSTEADLTRLRGFRNEIANINSTACVDETTFPTKWNDIEQVLLRLNNGPQPVTTFQQTIDIYKNSSFEWRKLENALESEINLVKDDMKTVKEEITLVKEDIGVKSDNKDVKSAVEEMKTKVNLTEEDVKGLKMDFEQAANLIPTEILRMDNNSVELYKRALSEGKEAVHNIRVMVVGHYGVGKTTLTKRMFGEDVDISNRQSTEGIDVHVRKCKVSLETGQWNIVDKDEKKEMMCRRLIKFLKNSETIEKMTENNVPETDKAGPDGYDIVGGLHSSMEENASIEESENNETEDLKHDYIPDNATLKESSGKEENHDIDDTQPKEEYTLNHLKALIDEIQQHSIDSVDSNSAALSLWDFAGQFVFYATHQVFLSRRAVYLIVTDISKHVQDSVQDDDIYMDGKGVNHWKISEFVDFWLNSIHEFCNSPDEAGPPAILIGTFADKLDQETKAETLNDRFYAMRDLLSNQATFCHLIDEDFAMDNTTIDANIEKLKQKILDTASKQSYWGELIPAKWITLEKIIFTLKEEDLKVLTIDRLHDLNSTLPVPLDTKEELDLFLRFHHESGNLLYFSDEKLQDNIVLEPQWLIDAFKSLITARMFCCRKRQSILNKWQKFDDSAILTKDLVDAIWKKEEYVQFHQYKDLLLDYLEKLGLIAKPMEQPGTSELADYYFAPCVLKTPPPVKILKCDNSSNQRSSSKLCFKTSSGFLPTAVFNKLLAACIRRWELSKRDGKALIFCGCGVFDLKENNHTVYLYFFNHVIQIWLTKLSTAGMEPDQTVCSNVREFVSDMLRTKFKISSSIEIYVKCPQSDPCSGMDFFAIDVLAKKPEVVCSCGTSGQHPLPSIDLTKYWQCSKANPENYEGVPTDKEIGRIAQHIGAEYMSLGLELGLSKAELDHINLDGKTTVDRITTMLMKWKLKEVENATLEILRKALEIVGADTEKVLTSIRKTDTNYST